MAPFPARYAALCIAFGLAVLLVSPALAQDSGLYFAIKGGVTTYGGELDQSGTFDDPQDQASRTAWLTRDFGPAFGLEAGYQFSRSLSLGLTGQYARYINLDEAYPTGDRTVGECRTADLAGTDECQVNQGETLPSLIAAFRFSPFQIGALSPFINAGGQLTFGNDDPAERPIGFGPYAGLGLDYRLTNRLSLTAETNLSWIFGDTAVDGIDPDGQTGSAAQRGAAGDEADYDNLGFYSVGLRFTPVPPSPPPPTIDIECSSELMVGEDGMFTATLLPRGVQASITWDWGDGSIGRGENATHAFRQPGTYTVTAIARDDFNEAMDTCIVDVPGVAPRLTCQVSPAQIEPNGSVTLDGSVNSDATRPVTLSIDWGDRSGPNPLALAGNTFTTTHRYEGADTTYIATVTASNAYGEDACTQQIQVMRPVVECLPLPSRLGQITFGLAKAELEPAARETLRSNVDRVRPLMNQRAEECRPMIRIEAYTDLARPAEDRFDDPELSRSRANAIRDYYIEAGIDAGRIDTQACGLNKLATKREGERNRRIGETRLFETRDAMNQTPDCPLTIDKTAKRR